MSTINVNHITKEYHLGHLTRFKDNLKGILASLHGQPSPERKIFKALDDIDFKVKQGEVLGIIGHNGAGKSTLLKILSNIIQPTSGTIRVQGKIAPLIEVGAGLVGDLTGRENIYLNASILGIPRRQISKILDEIITFSELEEFIDTPIKRYSSGMKVKLGFSIATSIDAEILIVDEVLAVGDLAFQRKCFDRMEKMIKSEGRTVLLVSHNIRQVMRLCSRVIMLNRGKVLKDGDSQEVCNLFYEKSNQQIAKHHRRSISGLAGAQGSGELELLELYLVGEDGNPTETINLGSVLRVRMKVVAKSMITKPEFVVGTHTTDFVYLTTNSTSMLKEMPDFSPGRYELECTIPNYPLRAGTYCIRLAVFDSMGRIILEGESLALFSIRTPNSESKQAIVRLLEVDAFWKLNGQPIEVA